MSLPRTLGELQLYRVLQRANLLVYYDTFIQQGGDDVQQLCEAGEEEFLEIMALVGMATKPLHVRRLQKALRDWASNPAQFNQPLGANTVTSGIPLLRIDGANSPGTQKPLNNGRPSPQCDREEQRSCLTPLRNNSPKSPSSQASPAPQDHLYRDKLSPMEPHWLSPEIYGAVELDEECSISPLSFDCHSRLAPSTSTASSFSAATSPWPGGLLDPDTVRVMEESVNRLLRTFPQAEPGEVRALLRLNKKLSKTVGHIFNMEPQDKSKDEEIRKYSLIYGRFDSKRREGKQLTHHEMLINEAAAQICIRDNGLLLRRVELFSLARQVARECAYTSTFKHNRTNSHDSSAHDCSSQKRMRLDVTDRTSNDSAGLSSDIRSTADENSLSGESLDSSTQDISPHFPSSSLHPLTDSTGLITWSRQLMQQTLMDEGLRLARMVSCDHGSRVSLVSEKRRVPETEETVSDRNAQHS